MDNPVYIALSRQTALFRDLEVTANNIANVNTVGYQSQHMMFNEFLVQDAARGKMTFTNDISTYRNTRTGSLRTTGNPFDLAIQGDAYFVVDTPQGQRYTRAGNFTINDQGILVTQEGYPVLDTGGQTIAFDPQDTNITIGGIGNISVNGEERATLDVVTFENTQKMKKIGERLYDTDQDPQLPEKFSVTQGALENANVDPVLAITHLVDISRQVGSTAKFIEVIYDLQRKGNNVWAQQG